MCFFIHYVMDAYSSPCLLCVTRDTFKNKQESSNREGNNFFFISLELSVFISWIFHTVGVEPVCFFVSNSKVDLFIVAAAVRSVLYVLEWHMTYQIMVSLDQFLILVHLPCFCLEPVSYVHHQQYRSFRVCRQPSLSECYTVMFM